MASPAADRATAAAINLVANDLPGWTPSRGSDDTVDASDVQTAACMGAPNPRVTEDANVNSMSFDEGPTEVSSSVDFVRTRADSLDDLRAFTGAKITSCLQREGSTQLSAQLPKGTTVDSITVAHMRPPSLLRDGFALRLTVDLVVPQHGLVTVSADDLGFVSGRAEVGLTVVQTQGTPSASFERYLLSVLETRTQEQGTRTA
ncbi:MAG TPA: hypothetical protein VLZ77_09050 [Acidimicrobiales bacterium]|nr:hypothetical protein [Acidimicrobiales bacterium]